MTKKVFRYREALGADDPVARWIVCLAIARDEIVFMSDLYMQHPHGADGVYLVRVAAGHLSELGDDFGPFAAGYLDWPQVQAFVAALPRQARADFRWLARRLTDRSKPKSFAWKLDKLRNSVFHYPHLQAGRTSGARLPLRRVLHTKRLEEGSITVAQTVGESRYGFAAELAVSLAFINAGINPRRRVQLRAFTRDLVAIQQRLIQFADMAIDTYLVGLPPGVLRSVPGIATL